MLEKSLSCHFLCQERRGREVGGKRRDENYSNKRKYFFGWYSASSELQLLSIAWHQLNLSPLRTSALSVMLGLHIGYL